MDCPSRVSEHLQTCFGSSANVPSGQIRYRLPRLGPCGVGNGLHVPPVQESACIRHCLCYFHEQVRKLISEEVVWD